MNRGALVDRVVTRAGLTNDEAERVLDAIFDTATGAISEAVHTAGSVQIMGFGTFTKKTRKARTGRNPKTGAKIDIPESTTVSFTPGTGLREGRSTSRKQAAARGLAVGIVIGAAAAAATAPRGKKDVSAS